MKEVTLIHEVQITSVVKNVEDTIANAMVSTLGDKARTFEKALKRDIGADHVSVTGTHVFVRDQQESKEEIKQRELRELTEMLLQLISE